MFRTYSCPECGDQFIHLNNRGMHESSSGLTQRIHDLLPRTADIIDNDDPYESWAVVRQRLDPPLWWHKEHKPRGKSLGTSQKFFLPRLAETIKRGVESGIWHSDSGVFVVWSDPPYDTGAVQRIGSDKEPVELSGTNWDEFLVAADSAPFL